MSRGLGPRRDILPGQEDFRREKPQVAERVNTSPKLSFQDARLKETLQCGFSLDGTAGAAVAG